MKLTAVIARAWASECELRMGIVPGIGSRGEAERTGAIPGAADHFHVSQRSTGDRGENSRKPAAYPSWVIPRKRKKRREPLGIRGVSTQRASASTAALVGV